MTVDVKYGRGTIPVSFPEGCTPVVIRPEHEPGADDPVALIGSALDRPIASPSFSRLLEDVERPGIVFSDATRATPNRIILPVLLEAIRKAGIPDRNVTLFNATGTHRMNTADELRELLGREIVERFRIVQNRCTEEQEYVFVGTSTAGNEIHLNRELVACDLRILTGYIEPHFFAGFSGGGKAVMPGCARLDTIRRNHGAKNIDHRESSWGSLEENPIAREVLEAARMCEPCFLLNVALNRDREITGAFAGDLESAHREGCRFVEQRALKPVDRRFDLVITSNAGYPLDRNLYQTVKGMSAAARIVKPGGSILVLSECRDGIPSEGNFGSMLASVRENERLLESIRNGSVADRDVWQVQILCRIAEEAKLYLYSDRLTDEEVRQAHCIPISEPSSAVDEILRRSGPEATVCVLPEGPETIPLYVRRAENAPSR